MPRSGLTGTRIRETRMRKGLRQAELARRVGVSPSYLNLIEHNRRRPGPALAERVATALDVAPAVLTEGAEDPLLDSLREAAAAAGTSEPTELERMEEFVGRFPGWATLLTEQHRRLGALERTVERLTDRMAHDPYLSAALHEVLSAVSSVRATAAILAETEDIDADWRRKFHANLHGDSVRLAEGAQALVGYLDAAETEESGLASPQEELEAWLAARGHHVPELETDAPPPPETLFADAPELATRPARTLAERFLARYRADAEALPLSAFLAALDTTGPDPAALAGRFGVPLPRVLRRLIGLPPDAPVPPTGLVTCDASGTLIFRKPISGFALPRFGAACPLWPLYQALGRPGQPLRVPVEMAGRLPRRFVTYAICESVGPPRFDMPAPLEVTMLIMPADEVPSAPEGAAGPRPLPIGTSCRICSRRACPARREPSILAEGF